MLRDGSLRHLFQRRVRFFGDVYLNLALAILMIDALRLRFLYVRMNCFCFELVLVSMDILTEIAQLAGIDFMKFSLLRIIKLLRLLHGV